MTLTHPSAAADPLLYDFFGVDEPTLSAVLAEAMGRGDQFGTVEAGKLADLIVLSEDPRETVRHFRSLTHVMRNGVLNTQSDLRVFDGD